MPACCGGGASRGGGAPPPPPPKQKSPAITGGSGQLPRKDQPAFARHSLLPGGGGVGGGGGGGGGGLGGGTAGVPRSAVGPLRGMTPKNLHALIVSGPARPRIHHYKPALPTPPHAVSARSHENQAEKFFSQPDPHRHEPGPGQRPGPPTRGRSRPHCSHGPLKIDPRVRGGRRTRVPAYRMEKWPGPATSRGGGLGWGGGGGG